MKIGKRTVRWRLGRTINTSQYEEKGEKIIFVKLGELRERTLQKANQFPVNRLVGMGFK